MKKTKFFVVSFLTAVMVAVPTAAYAYNWSLNPGYWDYADLTLNVYDTSNYTTTAQRATNGWNGLYYKVNLIYNRTLPANGYSIRIASGSYVDEWDGATSITLQDGEVKSGENTSNWDPSIPYMSAWASLNERVITANNETYDQRTALIAHELGHSLAIGHDSSINSIMYPYTCNVALPGQDEADALTHKYASN